MEALAAFKEGKLQVLVATDVAARGLDIDDMPLVVNYELPHVPGDYIHRIGRTGRAGLSGEAISLVAPEEERYLADIERLLKKKVEVVTADGFDPATARFERSEHPPRARRGERTERPARAPREAHKPRSQPAAGTPRQDRGESAHPSERPARAPREAHKPRSQPAGGTPRHDRGESADPGGPSYGDQRREERERAYALNPDQPPAAKRTDDDAATSTHAHHGRKSFGHGKPVPALLMKRKASEPEKV
jgi:ATP-dependent RNA helicase RhlE